MVPRRNSHELARIDSSCILYEDTDPVRGFTILSTTKQYTARGALHSAFGVTLADARDPELPLAYANHAFLQVTGYELHEILGRNCRFLRGEERTQPGVESIRHAINERQASTTVLKNFTKDGDVFWNEFTITPLTNATGKVEYFLGIQHDITDLMAARERFQRK